MIKNFLRITALAAATTILLCSWQSPKYVFYMIGDGMGINEAIGTQIYNEAKGYEDPSVNFVNFPVRSFVTTHCLTTLVTDSAAAGTALATGSKTYYGAMGVGEDKLPLKDMTERAIEAGFGAGVVTSVGVNHATPAAFYAHTDSRNNYDIIASQLFASKLSFAAGGGFNIDGKVKRPAEEYVKMAKDAGWEVYQGKDSFKNLSSKGQVLCLGDNIKSDCLKYAIDQKEEDTKLADFTKAAVDHLYANHKNGFFLMVEGGSIDHSCHDDDGATTFEEVNDFARAIDVVLEFYRQHPKQTLIVVTADHETGGLMLGSGKYSMDPKQITYQTMSEGTLSNKLREMARNEVVPTWDEVKAVLSDALGLYTHVKVDAATDVHLYDLYVRIFAQKSDVSVSAWYSLNSALASDAVSYVNKVAGYGWSYEPHSGSPVGVYAIGAGSEAFNAAKDNTDIPNIMAKVAKYVK